MCLQLRKEEGVREVVRAFKMRIRTQLQPLKEMLGRGKEHKPTLDQEVSSGDIWVGP